MLATAAPPSEVAIGPTLRCRVAGALVAVAVLVSLAACGEPVITAGAVEEAMLPEEYQVYSAMIQAMFIDAANPELIVIHNETDVNSFPGPGGSGDAMHQAWPDLADETIADFESRNAYPQALQPLLSLSVGCVFVSEQEVEALFSDPALDGWDAFYKKYPNSQGLMTLSRVGFDPNLETAVVYVGNQFAWLGGKGCYVLFEKVDGRWTVRGERMLWIS